MTPILADFGNFIENAFLIVGAILAAYGAYAGWRDIRKALGR